MLNYKTSLVVVGTSQLMQTIDQIFEERLLFRGLFQDCIHWLNKYYVNSESDANKYLVAPLAHKIDTLPIIPLSFLLSGSLMSMYGQKFVKFSLRWNKFQPIYVVTVRGAGYTLERLQVYYRDT